MIKEEEKMIFRYELDKLLDDFRKCNDRLMRQKIKADIVLVQKVMTLS